MADSDGKNTHGDKGVGRQGNVRTMLSRYRGGVEGPWKHTYILDAP